MEVDTDVQSEVQNLKSEISCVQNELKFNSNNYDGHVKLITLLSKLYRTYKAEATTFNEDAEEKMLAEEQASIAFKKLRNARKSMSAAFPLTVELWVEWIEDEMQVQYSLISHDVLEDIFSKATVDYLSVDIWCLYMKYLIGRLEESDSNYITASFIRDIFEKAVLNCGLHYKDGHKIWESYLQFELKYLLEAQNKLQENNNLEDVKAYKFQLLKVIKIFKRQMSIPLVKHDELFEKCTSTIEPHIKILQSFNTETEFNADEMESVYKAASTKIDQIKSYEDNLEESLQAFDAYHSYITYELDSGVSDPARVQCLFERAIVHHCLKPSLWLDYIDFLNNVIKIVDLAIIICKRALRNVTWDSRIYINYVSILEQDDHDVDEIRETYKAGLQKYSDNGFNYCSVWISFMSFEKRISEANSKMVDKKLVYDLIQRALSQFQGLSEPDKFILEFILFWVDIERYWFKDERKVEIIWKYVAVRYKNNYNIWYQAVNFARNMGNKNLVTDLFYIGLVEFPDAIEIFSQSWLNFERILGSINSFNQLMKKINIYLPSSLQNRKSKECLSIKSKVEHIHNIYCGKNWLYKTEQELFNVSSTKHLSEDLVLKKRNRSSHDLTSGIMTNDRQESKEELSSKIENNENNEASAAPAIGPVLPPGFRSSSNNEDDDDDDDDDSIESGSMNDDFEDDDHDEKPPLKKARLTEKNYKKESSQPVDFSQNKTVFISNLHPSTKETDLRTIFSRAGDVQKIDLRKVGRGKVYAYITFQTTEEAQKAFELEHTPIYNRPVFVSELRQTKERHTGQHYSQQQEKNKLFVSNLDKSTKPSDLENIFNTNGEMTSLRLINKKGSSKPFAYVEYNSEEAATRYRSTANNAIIKGRMITVEYSEPPISAQNYKPKLHSNFAETSTKIDKTKLKEKSTLSEKRLPTTSDNGEFKKPSVPFGFIPMQARNRPHFKQDPTSKSKGPTVRLNFVPAKSSDDSVTNDQSQPASEKTEPASVQKSNEDFRKMLMK